MITRVSPRAASAAVVRLIEAAKRLDDYVNCRLGVVVADEVRVAIYAEHSAAVAGVLPFFALANEAAPVGEGRAAA